MAGANYLTTKQNYSFLGACYAKAGSTVDHAILPHGISFIEQIRGSPFEIQRIVGSIRLVDRSKWNQRGRLGSA